MKFQFNPDLTYQSEAINSIVDIFEGQEVCRTTFTVAPLHQHPDYLEFMQHSDLGVGNRLRLLPEDIHNGICEGDEDTAMRLYLTELYWFIQRLMDATFAAQDQGVKVLLATMEKRAREYKQEIEGRLGVRN